MITLLLTNGARHPYKIDEKYLKKRSVNVEGNNPINMSTYTLKELIWREWREGKSSLNSDRMIGLILIIGVRMGSSTFESKFYSIDILWKTAGRQNAVAW